jgi:hypothetical protein
MLKQIFEADTSNLEYRMKYIYTEFEKNDFWAALTEFMRFEADAMH